MTNPAVASGGAQGDRDRSSLSVPPTADYQLFDALPADVESALRASIERFGVLVPVTVDQHGVMLDGHHRARLADELGVPYDRLVRYCDGDDERHEVARTLNADRRQLTGEQRRQVAADLRGQGHSLRAIAAAVAASKDTVARDLATVSPETVPDRVIGLDGRSRPTRRPQVLARNDRERRDAAAAFEYVNEGPSTWTATEARLHARRSQVAASVRPSVPLHTLDRYALLLVDPPWRYEHMVSESRRVENHYPTMSLDEIRALDVPAAADCVLYLWAPSPKVAEAITVMQSWGFEYRTCLVWVKDRIGLGYYARQQHELLLVGRRGAPPVPAPADRSPSVIHAPRGRHSEKPDEVYDLLDRAYPGLAKCELFARTVRDGWAGWGNQYDPAAGAR